jgi:hypothetical protein
VSYIAEKRAEILGMITRLDANKRVGNGRLSAMRPQRASPSPMAIPPELHAHVMSVLSSVEARLARIEDRLERRSRNPPSARAGPPPDATIAGLIKGQMLSDILQLVTSNAMSGLFVIETDISRCNLYFCEGRICHAENGQMVGEDAFFAAFGAENGRYHFTETDDLPAERTVSVGTQYLVLEALRRMDESRA